MKWAVAALVLLNAALFLWATGFGPQSDGRSNAYPVISEESMRLVSEVAPGGDIPDESRCARLGPFSSSAVASLAAQKLDAMGLSYSRRTVEAREIRAHRVYLGPFQDDAELADGRRELEARGLDDHYVKREDSGGDIVSLGLFSRRTGALARMERLQEAGIEARLRSEDRLLAPDYWLEIDDPALADGLPAELRQVSWGDAAARIRPYACP